jgi:hypothetical protein
VATYTTQHAISNSACTGELTLVELACMHARGCDVVHQIKPGCMTHVRTRQRQPQAELHSGGAQQSPTATIHSESLALAPPSCYPAQSRASLQPLGGANDVATLGVGWGGRPSYWRRRPRPSDPLFFLSSGCRAEAASLG